jgi:hypothetical protein
LGVLLALGVTPGGERRASCRAVGMPASVQARYPLGLCRCVAVGFGRADYAATRGEPVAGSRIRSRAWTIRPRAGWSRLSLKYSYLAFSTTRPGTPISKNQTAFIRRFAHAPPSTTRFIAGIAICHHAATHRLKRQAQLLRLHAGQLSRDPSSPARRTHPRSAEQTPSGPHTEQDRTKKSDSEVRF